MTLSSKVDWGSAFHKTACLHLQGRRITRAKKEKTAGAGMGVGGGGGGGGSGGGGVGK